MEKEQLDSKPDKPYSCGLGPAFDVIGGKWKAVILWELHEVPLRFGILKRRIPAITEKMLIQQLREMESDGLVVRKMYHEVPPRVEYYLSKSGHTLNDSLETLAEWGKKYAMERNIVDRYII